MFEAFRLQLREILDGRKKWLVLLFVTLPVLLTWVNMNVGGLGDLKLRIEEQQAEARGEPRDRIGARRVAALDEPIKLFGGQLVVTKDRILFGGRPVPYRAFIKINDGQIVVEDGEVWVNDTIRWHGRPTVFYSSSGRPTLIFDIPWETISAVFLFLLYPQTICLLLALFYGSSLLGNEIDNKTLTYLFTRPVARWRLIVGKYAAIVLALIPPTAISLGISWWMLGRPGDGLLAALLAGSAGGLLAYNAIFILLGFIAPKRAMVLALLYGVVIEFILSFVPALVNTFTVTYYLRSLVVEMVHMEVPRELSRIVGGATLGTSLLTLLAMVLLGLGGSALLASRREYVLAEQA